MRVINIDLDTAVGYDYEAQYYFVTNKSTTTTRTTAQDTLNVLNIVAPDNTVTENDLISLSTTYETLTDLSYTWDDTGSYIKTIQFNDYSKYPLCLDGEKKKIYIMNSTTIFDLTLNEGRRTRLEQIQAFYRDTIGLYLTLPDIQILYMLLVHFYNPTCYNEITIENNTDGSYIMFYNDTLKLSNFRATAPLTYSCKINPTNQYNYTTIGEITAIEENVITLTTPVPSQVKPYMHINISNTASQIDTTTYTADGTYTVQSVQDNQIFTTENLPASFNVILPTLNIQAYINTIESISREEQKITLTNSATDLLVGDIIEVRDAKVYTEYETLSLDGSYSIIGIEGNEVYVEEVPLTDYTATTGQEHYIYKPIPTLTVTGINNNIITVAEDQFPTTLTVNTPVVIYTTVEGVNTPIMQYCTVTGLDEEHKTVVVDTTLTDNVPNFGLLRQPIPYDYVLTTVQNSTTNILPDGQFMLDTHGQAISYLSLVNDLPLPSNETLQEDVNNIGNFNSCGTQVRTYYIIDTLSVGIDRMTCKGIYSRVYTE